MVRIKNKPSDPRDSLLFWLGLFIAYIEQTENLDKTKLHQISQQGSTGISYFEIPKANIDWPQPIIDEDQLGNKLRFDLAAAELEKIKAETEFIRVQTAKSIAERKQAEAETEKAITDAAQTKRRIKNPIEFGSLIIAILSFLLSMYTSLIAPTSKLPGNVVPPYVVQPQESNRLRRLVPNRLDKLLYFLGPLLLNFSDTLRAAEFSLMQGADAIKVRDSLVAQLESIKAYDQAQIKQKALPLKNRTQQQFEIKRIDTLITIFSKV